MTSLPSSFPLFIQAKQLQLFQSFLLNHVLSLITSCIFIFFALSWNTVAKCRYLHQMKTHQCWTETWFCVFWRLSFSLNIYASYLFCFFFTKKFNCWLVWVLIGMLLAPSPLFSEEMLLNLLFLSPGYFFLEWFQAPEWMYAPPKIRWNLLHSFHNSPLQIYPFMLTL